MNFLKILKDWGATIVEDQIDLSLDSKFFLNRDAGAYLDFVYILKYNKIPSNVYIEYKKSRFEELIKYLISLDFQVVYIKCNYSRYTKNEVIMRNDKFHIMVELASNASDGFDVLPDGNMVQGSSEDENANVTISFDASVESDIPFQIKEKFFITDIKDNGGKILLFEKDSYNEIILTPHKVKSYDLNLEDNYNEDFIEIDSKIQKWAGDFTTRNNKLVLLHGIQGSGKTNYIKYLLNSNPSVKKIYIPPYFVQSISDPAFFPVIKREKESLLIIEDAEKILLSREENGENSVISTLLNLCDGIMADVLNFKIIATFNTDESRIDEALKRKGRMFLKYKFTELSEAKTKNLFNKVQNKEGGDMMIPPPKKQMTLAEIYNDENDYGPKKVERRVGFGI